MIFLSYQDYFQLKPKSVHFRTLDVLFCAALQLMYADTHLNSDIYWHINC